MLDAKFNSSDVEALVRIVSQLPVGGTIDNKYFYIERSDIFTFHIKMKSCDEVEDGDIESILFD